LHLGHLGGLVLHATGGVVEEEEGVDRSRQGSCDGELRPVEALVGVVDMRLEGHEGQGLGGRVALRLGQPPDAVLGGDATGGHAIEGGKGSHTQGESGEDDELGTCCLSRWRWWWR